MLKIMLLLLVFGIVNVDSVHAEDNSTVVTTENDSQEQKPQDDPTGEKTPEELTPDTFDPTEKLSEDHPVAFPADI